jgi:ABC-type bacteriocin/lantibiotic exporter with double-glycine peptidase domain
VLLVGYAGCATRLARPGSSDPHWIEIPGVHLFLVKEDADCGVAALATVLAFWRRDISLSKVRMALKPAASPQGLEAGSLRDLAWRYGVRAFLVEGTWNDLTHEIIRGRPVIMGLV